jgi:TDG/mug DNA glycosylase family protein
VAVLPDYLAPDLRVVFCGTAVATESARRGHYYAGPGNEFWRLLYESGLTAERLSPDHDRRVLDFGVGLTDLAKHIAQSHDRGLIYDLPAFTAKIEAFHPAWVAFHGKEAAKAASRALGHGNSISLGHQA